MRRINLMGFEFASTDFPHIINEIQNRRYLTVGFLPFLITPNADQVLQFDKNTELREFYERSYFVLADGFPIVLFSKLVKKPLPKRLPGSDLFPKVWSLIKEQASNTFVVVPSQKVGVMLQQEYPLLRYHVAGILDLKDNNSFIKEVDLIISKIDDWVPEFLIVGLGFPKQELLSKLLYEKMQNYNTPLFMLLGASFEFYLGIKKRAPLWVQLLGLEWLHRLIQEPKRLWRRYTIGNFMFIIFFVKHYLKVTFDKRNA